MQNVWLATVPNNDESSEKTFADISGGLSANMSKCYRFEIPKLTVGTLDSLMSLSDDLVKINMQVENIVKKIERQYADVAGQGGEPLRVNETAIEAYFRRFQWDYAHYQYQGRQLNDIVAQVQSMTGKIEEELKMLSNNYTEKNLALAATQRRKQVNVSTSEFEDFLTPEKVAKLDILDTEHLLTVMVVIGRGMEADFLSSYSEMGSQIAAFGGPDWSSDATLGRNDGRFGKQLGRSNTKGSPIVPGSHLKVAEEGDSIMYAITVLKGHYEAGCVEEDIFTPGCFVDYVEPIKAIFREKRFIVREFSYDAANSGGLDVQIEQSKLEFKQMRNTIIRWCKAHFGEAYNGWVHLKVIRAFVESVLRYGLPVDFTAFFIEPNMKMEKEVLKALTKSVLQCRPALQPKSSLEDEDDEGDFDTLPYVCQCFPLIGANS